MKDTKDVCVVVSARLHSHRIPQKMLAPFADTTLLDIAIRTLLSSKIIPKQNIILAAYEKEIISIGEKYGINIHRRSEKSAKSEGKDLTVLYDWHDKLNFKYVVLLNPCLPFLTAETIDGFFSEYLSNDFDGMFGVIDKKNYFWDSDGNLITEWTPGLACMNTKFVASTYEAANCLYASRLSLIKEGIWMGKAPYTKNNPVIYPIPEEECFDIDYPWQFARAEALYRSKK
jgi:CMP-N-acetylneuraminic acid synthetase